jgi:copper(I)-binding protein
MSPHHPSARTTTAARPGRSAPGTSHGRTARRGVAAALAALLVAGCGVDEGPANNAPGMNVRVDDIAVRYAHLEDPDAAGAGHRVGDDVPLYLWFVNESGEPAQLTEVSSPVATDVSLSEGRAPVDLPVGTLVDLGPDERHFVLEDITTRIRGAEFVPVSLAFSTGTVVEIMVEAIEIGPID